MISEADGVDGPRPGQHNARVTSLLAAARLIHPAPAVAVTLLSAVMGLILLDRAGLPVGDRLWLTVLAVAGSQVFTGATNDLADRERDLAAGRTDKPLVAGEVTPSAALWLASGGLAVQLAASLWLGWGTVALGLVAALGAAVYNLALSRTPLSPVPYLVSFGVLPLWIASGVGVDLGGVLPAVPLAALFAVAAHLANTLRDFTVDAAVGSRSLAQVIGRRTAHRLAVACALASGLGLGLILAIGGGSPASFALGAGGLVAIGIGARSERRLWYALLVAAVLWTAAWALSAP
jgi:4-hydroxybenzoate polyprenyltransferase